MKNNYIKRSLIFFNNVKGQILLLALMNIFIVIIRFFEPIIDAKLVTSITTMNINLVIKYALLILIVLLFETLTMNSILVFWRNKVKTKVTFNIRKNILNTLLELRISNFDKYSTGMFQERIKSDPYIIAESMNFGLYHLMHVIYKISALIYIFFINYVLGAIYLIGVIIAIIVNNHYQKNRKEKMKKSKDAEEVTNSILNEVIRGIRDIKLLNFKNNIKNIVSNKLNSLNELSNEVDNYDDKYYSVDDIILYITATIVIIVGIKFVNLGLLTYTNLLVLYLYRYKIFSLMYDFSNLRKKAKEYELALERIFALENEVKYPKDYYGDVHINNLKGKIEFDNVSFGYKQTNKVFENLSLTIEPKKTVAIVGASGAGKTTIFNLLTKSYLVDSGELRLDDVNINELDEKTIRKNISIITQNPYIFNMSIKDNLKLVKPNATQKEIEDVCKKACFYDFIISLPDKYDTIIGEGGVNLSGGQKQRLAIARALLKDYKILLLDEATSSLDNITQKEIQETIEHISSDYTIIIIAHRLSTIINCNPIYILKNGKIIDKGSHRELLNRNLEYKKLYKNENK